MFEYFTDRAIAVVMLSQEEARRLEQSSVGTEQLLLGILREQTSLAAQVLAEMGVGLDDAREAVEGISGRGSGPVPAEIPFTPKTRQVLEQALQEARQRQQRFVGPEHVLLAVLSRDDTVAAQALRQLSVSVEELQMELLDAIEDTLVATVGGGEGEWQPESRPRQPGKTPMLEEFGTNLTEKALAGQLDPIVGRDKEIERVIQILGRRTKNNPVLVGEPGVGKTALAEGLAQRIANEDVPPSMFGVQVVSLDLTGMVAGTRFRGEFEERLTQLLAEMRENPNTVLVIDEIHTLMGAGAMGGSMDAANLMKPALARGEIQCIGATTLSEFTQYIERDAALERRFQKVMVGEPDLGDTLEILRGVRHSYELHHRLTITDDALAAAASLSERYISDRFLPDKAIDLIDEASSRVRLRHSHSKADRELRLQLGQVLDDKQGSIRSQDFAKAAELREREVQLEAQIQGQIRVQTQGPDSPEVSQPQLETPKVEAEDIAQVLSAWTSIPVMKLTESESAMLLHLEEQLHERVIGQEEAVNAVSRAMRRARVNLQSPNRPIASFFFSGPTGVGKTELSKALAAELFGSEDAIIRVDMSEFMESHTISKLIGSPPGFIGHEEGGKLTEAVRRRPYSIVLLDEVEKAHPDVFNLMLQVLDDGRLTDSKGRVVDFKNTVIIMTSNLGSKAIEKGGQGLGFEFSGNESANYERMRDRVTDELKQFFRPEFLNRIDEVIVFRQLNEQEVTSIAEIMVAEISQRLMEKGIELVASDAFKALAVREGFDVRYGARPLRRSLQRLLEDPLAEAILDGTVGEGDTALIDVDGDGVVAVKRQQQLAAVASR